MFVTTVDYRYVNFLRVLEIQNLYKDLPARQNGLTKYYIEMQL